MDAHLLGRIKAEIAGSTASTKKRLLRVERKLDALIDHLGARDGVEALLREREGRDGD